MGSGVGVHTKDQIAGLTEQERQMLKQFIMMQLQNSTEIRQMILDETNREQGILPRFLAHNPNIRQKLEDASKELLDRLKQK